MWQDQAGISIGTTTPIDPTASTNDVAQAVFQTSNRPSIVSMFFFLFLLHLCLYLTTKTDGSAQS